ncbi:uncharacterized protein [Misgurnus anguillicaudatus]|uniref:uncharacterized protein n=1 Tax=Misgurnus anguillicaudatus TaxID=75329 RepID=UPI003CCF5116
MKGTDPSWLTLKGANGLDITYIGYVVTDVEIRGIVVPQKGIVIVQDHCLGIHRALLGMNVIAECWEELFRARPVKTVPLAEQQEWRRIVADCRRIQTAKVRMDREDTVRVACRFALSIPVRSEAVVCCCSPGERHRGERISECKCPGTGQGTEDGKVTAGNWPWFALMDEALGKSAAVTPPCLIASIQEEQPGPSTAQQVEQGRDEDEEDETVRNRSKDRAGHREEKRRREREDPVLQLLKEDMKYQREADERREAEARERSERFFSLLERLAEK